MGRFWACALVGAVCAVSLGCRGFGRTPLGPPAAPGTYDFGPGGPSFTISPNGVFDNGDNMNCATGVVGSTITLDCRSYRITGDWIVNPDGSVDTTIHEALYGEFDPALQHFGYTPLAVQ